MSQQWVTEKIYDPGYTEDYLSATQIKTYRTCPKQYWFRYETDLEGTKEPKGYLQLGSAVHAAIENVLESDDQPQAFSESALTRKFKAEYRDYDPNLDDDKYSTGLDCLETAARYLEAKQPTITGIEKNGSFALARDDVGQKFFGKLDVTTENALIDWKTGSVRDGAIEEERIQGGVYMMIYYQLFSEAPEEIQFVYLKEGKLRTIEPDDEAWNTMLKSARSLIRGKANEAFDGEPGDLCYFCDHEGLCPDSPAGVGNIKWENYK